MKEHCILKQSFSVAPEVIYDHWLSSEGHSKMTGGEAECGKIVGQSHTAWDGYIFGKNLELVENEKIVQSWRTTEFAETDEDSILSLKLNRTDYGCELVIEHTNIPEGQTQYLQGWKDHYFTPMKAFFNS